MNMFVFAVDFDFDATLLGYPRNARHSELLGRHRVKMKSSSLPAGRRLN